MTIGELIEKLSCYSDGMRVVMDIEHFSDCGYCNQAKTADIDKLEWKVRDNTVILKGEDY